MSDKRIIIDKTEYDGLISKIEEKDRYIQKCVNEGKVHVKYMPQITVIDSCLRGIIRHSEAFGSNPCELLNSFSIQSFGDFEDERDEVLNNHISELKDFIETLKYRVDKFEQVNKIKVPVGFFAKIKWLFE